MGKDAVKKEKKKKFKFPVLHFSKTANCQLGPGSDPSKMNRCENSFHFHFTLFFMTIIFFHFMFLSHTILTKLFLLYSQETLFKKS